MRLGRGATVAWSAVFALLLSTTAHADAYCEPPTQQPNDAIAIGRVVSAEGAELQHPFGESIRNAAENSCLYLGTTMVTNDQGRLTLELTPDIGNRDVRDASVMQIGPNARLTLKQQRRERSQADWVMELLDGWFQFFSGREVELDVDTPFITAGVRGTEFTLFTDNTNCAVDAEVAKGCSVLFVQEGKVIASRSYLTEKNDRKIEDSKIPVDASDSQRDRVIAIAGMPPKYAPGLNITPEDAVNWTLYYPPLIRFGQAGNDDTNSVSEPLSASAIALLQNGQVKRASELLADATSASGLALRGVLALKENNKAEATRLAARAIDVDKSSADAHLAMSYALQATFDLQGAVEEAEEAASNAPDEPLILARLAELALAQGNVGGAAGYAERSVELGLKTSPQAQCALDHAIPTGRLGDPILSRAYAVQGYVQLIALNADNAHTSFEKARCADGLSPLAYLGLGLAKIRAGRLDEGVRQLEITVAMDPKVSLYRSYLGKGYYEQNRLDAATRQFTLAKALDEQDPTPWLYEAFVARDRNDPVGALSAIEESKKRNKNRAVYRSRLLLDADDAVRSTGLGRMYEQLGFDELARLEATKSLQVDPGNYSAHRLLTDAFSREPRHTIARVSELLQARIRAPQVEHPVSPTIADSRFDSQWKADTLSPGTNEFSRLFQRDGTKATVSVTAGSNETFREEIRLSLAEGPASIGVTQLHGETNGYRHNNYQDDDYWNLLAQYRVAPATSIQFEYRNLDSKYGDSFWGFDPTDYFFTDDHVERVESWRIGGYHKFSASWDVVGIFRQEDATLNIDANDGSFSSVADEIGDQAEVQFTKRMDFANLVFGGSHFARDRRDKEDIPPFPLTWWNWDTMHETAYALLNLNSPADFGIPGRTSITIGASYEDLETAVDAFNTFGFFGRSTLKRDHLSPKLGVIWEAPQFSGANITLRAARFDTLKRALLADETLEPTTIVGFNQFYDDPEATLAKATAAGIDVVLPDYDLTLGLSHLRRRLDTLEFDRYTPALVTDEIDESTTSAYINWVPSQNWALNLSYTREEFDRNPNTFGAERIIYLDTDRVVANIHYFGRSGITLSLQPVWVRQKGDFVSTGFTTYSGNDEFVILNASASGKIPGTKAIVSLDIENVFDKTYRYQDTDPFAPRYTPERAAFVRVVVPFDK